MQSTSLVMSQEENNQTKLPAFKECIPEQFRFWIYILFLIGFQFSNGIYFSSMGQMSGELSVTNNDTMMMSHAVLIGLTMYFPLAFRMKFRFPNKTNLLIAASGLLICNILVPHIQSVPLLIIICFIAGFCRLYGTFECFSSILPKITPSYNYAVFLSFVFFVVIGVIQIFDIISANIIYYFNWRYVHFLSIGILTLVIGGVYSMMRPFRTMPKLRLYGIDWIGMLLWALFILSLIFVAQYGVQFNWTSSPYIRAGIGISILALASNLWRMTHIRHPFIEGKAFTAHNLWYLLLLFLFMDILLSTQHVLQSTYTNAILGYDYLTEVSLKWCNFIGMAIGALFSLIALTKLKMAHKKVMFIGMLFIVIYTIIMYFTISDNLNIEKLYLPLICCSFGQIIIFISLTVYAQATVPFKNYFQVLCILGFIRTGLASPIGGAIYSTAISKLMPKYLAIIGSNVNTAAQIPLSELNSIISSQALIATIKELFGWSIIFGFIILISILASHFKKNINQTIPSLKKKYLAFAKK